METFIQALRWAADNLEEMAKKYKLVWKVVLSKTKPLSE